MRLTTRMALNSVGKHIKHMWLTVFNEEHSKFYKHKLDLSIGKWKECT